MRYMKKIEELMRQQMQPNGKVIVVKKNDPRHRELWMHLSRLAREGKFKEEHRDNGEIWYRMP